MIALPRRPDVLCSGTCGRLLWRGTTSAKAPKCRDCRRGTPAAWKSRGESVTEWTCEHCGESCTRRATKGQAPRYCGPRCQARASDARKRNVRGEFAISDARRQAVYARDGWQCRICGDLTSTAWSHDDVWSPTLDHIEPQSHALIPDHSDANLRTTHWLCNQLRGAAIRTDDEVRALALARRREVSHVRTSELAGTS